MNVQSTAKKYPISDEEMAALRERAKILREEFKHKPGRDELISPEDQANAAPVLFRAAGLHQATQGCP